MALIDQISMIYGYYMEEVHGRAHLGRTLIFSVVTTKY